MKKNIYILIGALVLGVAIVAGFLLVGGQDSEENLPDVTKSQITTFKKGEKAPDVQLTDFEGNTHNLSDFSDKAVVLDFWAGWCPFCIEEMPELQKVQDANKDDLVIIGVHRTDTEEKEVGIKFAEEVGVSYLLATDRDGSLYRATGGFGMPVAVFIDKDGVVREIKSGPKTKEEIQEKVSNII